MPVMACSGVATLYLQDDMSSQPGGVKYKNYSFCTNVAMCFERKVVQTINYHQEKLGIGIDEDQIRQERD